VNAAWLADIPVPAAKKARPAPIRAAFLHLDFDLEQL
jgi:hypothetical protein